MKLNERRNCFPSKEVPVLSMCLLVFYLFVFLFHSKDIAVPSLCKIL